MSVESGIAIDQKGKANLLENEIKAMVEETEARKHNVFSGFRLLYHRLDLFEPAI